ncbi:MAG: hypothetical protein MUC94_12340, partial [bacterium]|nr:hypothetical protein [bacterium]
EYSGDLNLFYYYSDRLSHTHQANLESSFNFNENVRFNFGAAVQLRKFKPDFDFYDYQTLTPYAQLRWDLWQTTPIQLGYRFRHRDFQNLSELSYQEHHGFFQVRHFFPSRTTFIGEINLGQKTYTNLQNAGEVIIVTPKNSDKGRGQSHGWGKGMMASDTSVVAYNMTALKAQQLNLSAKFAQSIFSKTGMSIEYIKQLTPSNNIRYLTGLEYSYSKDDELYDDPYAYSSDELEVTITQVLPWQSSLKLYANWADKKYLYSIVTDSTVSPTQVNENRRDRQQLIGLIVQKNFKLNRVLKSLSFYASANYLANQSNDLYFDFDGFFVHSGFEFIF